LKNPQRFWKFDYEKEGVEKPLVIVIEATSQKQAERSFQARSGVSEATHIVEVFLVGDYFLTANQMASAPHAEQVN
jgi:hypothetical protein